VVAPCAGFIGPRLLCGLLRPRGHVGHRLTSRDHPLTHPFQNAWRACRWILSHKNSKTSRRRIERGTAAKNSDDSKKLATSKTVYSPRSRTVYSPSVQREGAAGRSGRGVERLWSSATRCMWSCGASVGRQHLGAACRGRATPWSCCAPPAARRRAQRSELRRRQARGHRLYVAPRASARDDPALSCMSLRKRRAHRRLAA